MVQLSGKSARLQSYCSRFEHNSGDHLLRKELGIIRSCDRRISAVQTSAEEEEEDCPSGTEKTAVKARGGIHVQNCPYLRLDR